MKGETSGDGEITRIIFWDTEFSACDGNGAWETGIEINVRDVFNIDPGHRK